MITESYRELNRQLLATGWGASAELFAKEVEALRLPGATVLDYGCGQGNLGRALPFEIAEYDPCVPGKDAPPAPADIVACIDVLEHIEPECLDDVLAHLRSLTREVAFLVISTQPAVTKLPDGRNAHLIVQPGAWWAQRLSAHFALSNEVSEGGLFKCIAR